VKYFPEFASNNVTEKMSQTVALLGATGLVGGHILQHLLRDPMYSSIRVISRRSVNIPDPKIDERIIAFDDVNALENAIAGCETVFVAVGTTNAKVEGDQDAYKRVDFDIPVQAAKAAAKHGVYGFALVSSVGANPDNNNNFYLKLKGVTEEAVCKEQIPQVLIFRPSLIIGERKERRFGEKIAQVTMPLISWMLPASAKKYKEIKAEDLAKAMVLASQRTPKGIHFLEYGDIMEQMRGER
jgi:uncharacterized protein YbjT (DUF2867 family)